MIILARLIEAWRDAQIFKAPNEPRGRAWHLLKYPQYGLWLSSGLFYFIDFYFWPGHESTLGVTLLRTGFVVAFDISVAYLVFEYFLKEFRK